MEKHLKFLNFQTVSTNTTTIRNQTKAISNNLTPIEQSPHSDRKQAHICCSKEPLSRVISGLVIILSHACSGDRQE